MAILFAAVGAVLLLWWDSSYENRIADGVRIGGAEVGGLETDDAARQIRASLIQPLQKNVVATYNGEKFKLDSGELRIRADIDGMVADALEASREGGILARSLRRISGEELNHVVNPQVSYSKKAVEGFIEGVAENLDRAAVDASVEPGPSTLAPVEAKRGRAVDTERLKRDVEEAVQSPHRRKVSVRVDKVAPSVTTEDLAGQYPTYITVDRSSFKLHLYKDLELAKTYTVALGKAGHDTPSGLYSIQNKAVDPVWNVPNSDWAGELAGRTIPPGPKNPLKARWLGIYNGAGIHGTSDTGSLGSNASHGCIRMAVPDVVDLYDRVPTGTPIYIS